MANIIMCLFVLVIFAVSKIEAARILGFFPTPSASHLLVHCAIADALAEAGHNVTVIGNMPNVYKQAKYNYIHIEGYTLQSDDSYVDEMVNKKEAAFKKSIRTVKRINEKANETLWHPKMRQFMQEHTENSFDLVIIAYFINDFHLGIGAHFKCPIVISFMIQPIFVVNSFVGNPNEWSYVPSLFTGLVQPIAFLDRVKNFFGSLIEQYAVANVMNYFMQNLYDYNFPPERYASLDAVRKNISLVFVNHHFSQGPIRPNVPALVEIGGIQIKEKPKPLPADLENILNTADKGVILFSLGSIMKGSLLTKEKASIMFNVLSKLPYTVLWKWGESDFPGTSANIIYKSWLPQDVILAHPKLKLFITHCGQGSVVESQYHGVPMVGIPLFGDQPANAKNLQNSGFGLAVDYTTLTEDALRTAILEVLENPKYSQAVKKFSKLYRDRPMTARQTVVYWVEYVLRHHGAYHMQSPAVHLNNWQLLSLDVIAFLVAIFTLVVFILVKLCKLLCCRSKKRHSTKEKRN